MKTRLEIEAIIEGHHQKYRHSCSPSLIEMLLKIQGKVNADYYDLQHKYKDTNVGLEVFDGQTIEGLTFHKHDESKDGTFADRIQAEWKNGRLFAAYTLNDGSTTDYHGWIIVDLSGDEVPLRSKYSECGRGEGRVTAKSILFLSKAKPPKITDLLFYVNEETHGVLDENTK